MKWNLKREILPAIIIAAFIALTLIFYPTLPERVPSHFDYHGNPDNYSSRAFIFWLNLGLILGLYFLLTFIPLIDPFWKKIEGKYNIFLIFRDLALAFFLFMYVITIIAAKQGKLEPHVLGIALGLLFILLGNYLPKLPRNFFFGIRSPWTLASDVVWKKTHIVGGWLFVLAGAAAIILSLFKIDLVISLCVTLGPVVIFAGIIYPLSLYRKIQREEKNQVPQL